MKIIGKIIHVGEVRSGTSKAGKEWQSFDFVISFKEREYERHLAFKTLNAEVISTVLDANVGAVVDVSYSVESEKYQDKWYTKAIAFNIGVMGYGAGHSSTQGKTFEKISTPYNEAKDDLPF
jgi:hypothetical protein